MKNSLYYTISPLLLFLTWEILSRTGMLDIRFFPPPSSILYHLFTESPDEGIFRDIVASLTRIFWGYLLGCLLGAGVGIIMGLSPFSFRLIYPVVAMLYPLPKIAILPLIMLVFGIGDLSKIVVVAIGSFFLVLMSTLNGVRNLSPVYFDIAQIHSVGLRSRVWHIVLPGSLPSIFTGLKLAIGYSLVIVVAAEFSGANEGIGYLIWQSWETFSIKSMYAGIFVIGFFGIMFAYLLDSLENRLVTWKPSSYR
ncbi:MAG: ABC transporter permease [Gammaproteobacteria bacterium]|nr:ABC transporter permease [Gammaproteobacteria bacterium]